MKNDENDKHTTLCNWVKYQRKRMKLGLMTDEQRRLFEALAQSRSREHTGGRRKKVEPALLFEENISTINTNRT